LNFFNKCILFWTFFDVAIFLSEWIIVSIFCANQLNQHHQQLQNRLDFFKTDKDLFFIFFSNCVTSLDILRWVVSQSSAWVRSSRCYRSTDLTASRPHWKNNTKKIIPKIIILLFVFSPSCFMLKVKKSTDLLRIVTSARFVLKKAKQVLTVILVHGINDSVAIAASISWCRDQRNIF